jgi:lysophospholipase L1-like esterase
MEFAYDPTGVAWPVASTVASVAGLALMFGQRAGVVAAWLAGLALADLRRSIETLARPWLACSGLLALAAICPGAGWLATLRGEASLRAEIELASADGYYEGLIRAEPGRERRTLADRPPCRTSFTDSGLMVEVPDYRRRVLRPNLDASWNGTTFRTDPFGHRGPSISRGKPSGVFRVVVLGSSNTMGHGVDDEQGYVRLLERALNDRTESGCRFEFVNLAVSGDSPTQRLARLVGEVEGLEPDWIISDMTALDFSLEEQHLRWVVDHGVEVPFDFVRDALARSGVTAQDDPDTFHKKLSPALKPMLDRTVAAWAEASRKLGAPMTIVILPRADSKTPSPHLFHLFRDLADRHGLAAIDLSGAFDRLGLDDYRIAPWDHHPNALGHRIIAGRLRDELMGDARFGPKCQ